MAACARCSSDVTPGAAFCPRCGTGVSADEALTRSRPLTPSADALPTTPRVPPSSPRSSGGIDHGRFVPGAVVGGRYRIIALLGRGGMGEVYRADDLTVGQQVALKFLPQAYANDAERLERLRGEVRSARQVAHPNVCRVYDIGEADGHHFISMEMVQGEDLAVLLRRIGRLPPERALQIARQLCAGLAAAHARGVLHRDLKPANVMLDERGTVRIMDFGLAGLAQDFAGDRAREGTPAYMAPEQLAGRGVSAASDVYALGLVLYEMFTGRPAFAGGPVSEMLRQREHSSPTPMTRLVDGIDDATERAILRCLEGDPAQRPPSVTAVAAALPGGDPLAAALAAGETPSPDIVAAAGGEGVISAGRAAGLAVATLVLLAIAAALFPWSTDLGVAPLPRTPDALADRARTILATLGHLDPAADEAWWFDRNYDYLLHEARNPDPARRVAAWPGSAIFVYRRSPVPLTPLRNTLVTLNDPPLLWSGTATLQTTPNGDVVELVVVPPQVADPPVEGLEPAWAKVIALTGLDPETLVPTTPRWAPPVATDVRRAWEWDGTRGAPDAATTPASRLPRRVEAAAYHGRVVYLAVVAPWDAPTRVAGTGDAARASTARRLRLGAGRLLLNVLGAALVVTVVVLARRNLAAGRGDRRGAGRVAVALLVTAAVGWVFSAHHVAAVGAEWNSFVVVAGFATLGAGIVWLGYMALEPYVRRQWPTILIGWSRLLAGRWRDPLVGRDVLTGLAVGSFMAVVFHLANAAPAWMPLRGQTPIFLDRTVLGGAGSLLGALAGAVGTAIVSALTYMGVLFLIRLVLERVAAHRMAGHPQRAARWTTAVTATLLVLQNLGAENLRIEIFVALLSGIVPILVLTRYGVLAFAALSFTQQVMIRYPLTFDFGRWYAPNGLFGAAVVVLVMVWATRAALGGRPLVALGHIES